ncbi:cytochrome P450 [Glomus cerebriforme]|uniref:Cytochrome P450 n=1 Tax=Glomus cerebriforme TaxID=658196 RepID=A0A397SUT3_9GLOM|nr:cytochrome P450 [Glomus cerebriforme]
MFTTIFFVIIFGIIYYARKINKIPKETEHIPYVSTLSVVWAIMRGKPHDEIQDLIRKSSKGHDIFVNKLGPRTYINILNPDYAKDLLMQSEDIAPKFTYKSGNPMREFFGNGMIFSNGDLWRTYRNLANPIFNLALSPEMVGETIIDFFAFMQQNLNRPIDVFEVSQRITIEVLGKLAFGYKFGCLESEETPQIIKAYKFVIANVESVYRLIFPWINKLPTENNRKFHEASDEFNEFIYNIIETKRNEIKNNSANYTNNGHVDLLTSMLELSKQEGIHIDTKQLRDEMATFFVGGHDTTSLSLSTTFYYLAKYPEIQEKARAEVISILGNESVIPTSDQLKEMKYIYAIIKESLRIIPPVPMINLRILEEPIKIGPYIIPKNVLCTVNIWQIHHDPENWKNPKEYNPERFLKNEKRNPFSLIPFSTGPRNCIGQNFSLMEQRVVLSMMLLKYNWTLPENSINKDKLILAPHFLLRPVDLKLIFTERN